MSENHQIKQSFIIERIKHMLPDFYYRISDRTGPIFEGLLYSEDAWHAESRDESSDEEDDPGAGQAAPHAGGGSPAGAGEAAPLLSATGISRRMKPCTTGVKPAKNFAGAGSRKGIRSVTTRWTTVTS